MSKFTDLVHRHFAAASAGDINAAVDGFADHVVTEMPGISVRGIDQFKAIGEAFQTAAPDQKMTVRNMYETGETVIVEGEYSGTQTGPLVSAGGTIPATGRSFSFPFCDVFTFADGLVVRHAVYWDNLTFLGQLGMVPAPEPAPA